MATRPAHLRTTHVYPARAQSRAHVCALMLLALARFGHAGEGVFQSSFDDSAGSGIENVVLETSRDQLPGRIYVPPQPNGGVVVLMHGCTGMWQSGDPNTVAQGAIEKWGVELSANGFIALAVDSYTSRTRPACVRPTGKTNAPGVPTPVPSTRTRHALPTSTKPLTGCDITSAPPQRASVCSAGHKAQRRHSCDPPKHRPTPTFRCTRRRPRAARIECKRRFLSRLRSVARLRRRAKCRRQFLAPALGHALESRRTRPVGARL